MLGFVVGSCKLSKWHNTFPVVCVQDAIHAEVRQTSLRAETYGCEWCKFRCVDSALMHRVDTLLLGRLRHDKREA